MAPAAKVVDVSGAPPALAAKIRPAELPSRKILRAVGLDTAVPAAFSSLMVTGLVAEMLAGALKAAELITSFVAGVAACASPVMGMETATSTGRIINGTEPRSVGRRRRPAWAPEVGRQRLKKLMNGLSPGNVVRTVRT